MRLHWLLLLLFLPLPAHAQDSGPWTLEDATGDVAYLLAEETELPSLGHGRADLVQLAIIEDTETIIMQVTVADLEPNAPGLWLDAARLDVRFRHGEVGYDVGTGIGQGGAPFAELRRDEGGALEVPVSQLDYDFDPTGVFTVYLPRELVRDENGAPAERGRQLEELHMDSHVHLTGVFMPHPTTGERLQPLGIRDRMPDAGGVVYDVLLGGPEVNGPIGLEVPLPYRASNGGQAAIGYELLLSSADARTFTVRTEEAPPQWTLTLPETVAVAAGETVAVAIFVETPFGHQHGGNENFTVVLEDAADPNVWGRAQLGIYYLDIPQPAGHHDTLFLHHGTSGPGPGGNLWINTAEPETAGAAINGFYSLSGSNETFRWPACLLPRLQLGIDANLTKEGTVSLPFSSSLPTTGTVEVRLIRYGPGEACDPFGRNETIIAQTPPTPVDDLAASPTFEAALLPHEQGDRVPFERDADLFLEILYRPDTPLGPNGPALQPGGRLVVPLDEYYDDRPGGVVGSVEETAADVPEDEVEAPVEESPIGALPLLAIVLGLLWRRR